MSNETPEPDLYLNLPRDEASAWLRDLLERGETLRRAEVEDDAALHRLEGAWQDWCGETIEALGTLFTSNTVVDTFSFVGTRSYPFVPTLQGRVRIFRRDAERLIERLRAIHLGLSQIPEALRRTLPVPPSQPPAHTRALFYLHPLPAGEQSLVYRSLVHWGLRPFCLAPPPAPWDAAVDLYPEARVALVHSSILMQPETQQVDLASELWLQVGYLIARLGPERVCLLTAPGQTLPSMCKRVAIVHEGPSDGWLAALATTLTQAGLTLHSERKPHGHLPPGGTAAI
ncbi:MAG: hypothetical protein ACPGUV_03645 [Polyangiales bacterium]